MRCNNVNCRYTVSSGWLDLPESSRRHVNDVLLSLFSVPRSTSSRWGMATATTRRRGSGGQGWRTRRCPVQTPSKGCSRSRRRRTSTWTTVTALNPTSNSVQTLYLEQWLCFVETVHRRFAWTFYLVILSSTALYMSVVSYQSLVFTISPTYKVWYRTHDRCCDCNIVVIYFTYLLWKCFIIYYALDRCRHIRCVVLPWTLLQCHSQCIHFYKSCFLFSFVFIL